MHNLLHRERWEGKASMDSHIIPTSTMPVDPLLASNAEDVGLTAFSADAEGAAAAAAEVVPPFMDGACA